MNSHVSAILLGVGDTKPSKRSHAEGPCGIEFSAPGEGQPDAEDA